MSICYFAINYDDKEYFTVPGSWSYRYVDLFKPNNPFCGMFAMKSAEDVQMRGQSKWQITNDCEATNLDEYEDITNKLYKEYCEDYGFKDTEGHLGRTYGSEEFPIIDEVIFSKSAATIYIEGERDHYRIDFLIQNNEPIKDSVTMRPTYTNSD